MRNVLKARYKLSSTCQRVLFDREDQPNHLGAITIRTPDQTYDDCIYYIHINVQEQILNGD